MPDDEQEKEDAAVETPRSCGACGGRGGAGCKWCTMGFQNVDQKEAWVKFRSRMRKVSSTYSLLEKVVRELIDGLSQIGTVECLALAGQGRECLHDWMEASPDTQERRDASMRMSLFQSEAVVALIKHRSVGV